MDGVDDLGAVDPLQIDRGDAEVRVSELSLDDDERHALMRHLDGMRVTELMLVPTSAQTPLCRPSGYSNPAWRDAANRRLAVAKIGIIHGHPRARSINGAR